MLKLLDRWLLGSYFRCYVACFASLVSLYLIVDLFTNVNEFLDASEEPGGFVRAAWVYYRYQIVLIFDRLCGTVTLLATTVTVAFLQRSNELPPFLSAGIPLRRILRPVFLGAVASLGVGIANRECLIPLVADRLQTSADDPDGVECCRVRHAYDPDGILMIGRYAQPREQIVHGFICVIPSRIAGTLYQIKAEQAQYISPGPQALSGGWLLKGATPRAGSRVDGSAWTKPVLEAGGHNELFVRTTAIDFQRMTRRPTSYQFDSTLDCCRQMQAPGSAVPRAMIVHLHRRLTQPLLTFLLVVLATAQLLRNPSPHLSLSAARSLVLAGAIHATSYICSGLGEGGHVEPVLAAWLPVLVFGPIACLAFDAMEG